MSTEKAAIAEVLQQLDPTNDDQWTDDGSPKVSEVQRLCNDETITRAQINEAAPGFARKVELDGDKPKVTVTQPPAPAPEASTQLSKEDRRTILKRRVDEAEMALADARKATVTARAVELEAEKRLARMITDHQRYFPAITPAMNIKQHLARQGELAMERAGLVSQDSRLPIERSMQDRKRNPIRSGFQPVRAIG